MSYNIFPRGSEWRKWDFHVHTPASYHSSFPDDWDAYVRELIMAINKHEIAVIATADYFTIDGYAELMNYYNKESRILTDGTVSAEITIIPGVELRLDTFNSHDDSINLHYLFDPKCSVDFIQQHFLQKLKVSYGGSDHDLRERVLIAIGKSITSDVQLDIISDNANLQGNDKNKYIKTALSVITLSQKDIVKAAKEINDVLNQQNISKSFLSAIAGKGHGSLQDLEWFDQNGHFSRKGFTRQNLIVGSDLVFSNNSKDIGFYLGKDSKTGAVEIEQRFKKLKACIWGSDCHSIETLLAPPNSKYTWIKADPTFDGLRQLIFEPADRVRIQEENPERRADYSIINNVHFDSQNDSKLFSTDSIPLNSNLNVIVGGKSSGKSILLYHIAKAVDAEQVEDRMGSDPYLFDGEFGFNFKVEWKDGHTDSLSTESDSKPRQITYIPQMYINSLAEKEKSGEEALNELIEEILSQNERYKNERDKIRGSIAKATLEIGHSITSTFQLLNEGINLGAEIRLMGDKAAINLNIAKTQKEIDELRKKAGFSEAENIEYERLSKLLDFYEKRRDRFAVYATLIETHIISLRDLESVTIASLGANAEESMDRLGEDHGAISFAQRVMSDEQSQLRITFARFEDHRSKELLRVKSIIQTHETLVDTAKTDIKPLLLKFKNQQLLTSLNEGIEKEKQVIHQIEEKEKDLNEKRKELGNVKGLILSQYAQLFEFHKNILNLLQQPEISKIGNDLELKTSLEFDIDRFDESFCGLLNRKANFTLTFGDSFTAQNEYSYDENKHLAQVTMIFDKILLHHKSPIKFRLNITPRDAAYKLFEDYFKIKYTIVQGDDDILKMSPGKRGLVLLQLILHLSNATHPILIDQPEDNLDNRTIFNNLNQFIKDRKRQRQIIIVTHNANLVVSTDAEQVIVANQNGQELAGQNREFKFEYVSGALENTFEDKSKVGVLYKLGIREHVCDILEGGKDAFKKREEKYGF